MSAFRACYADWKLIKTRSTVQIVLEVPIEQADEAYQVLGGMPNPGSETWVGVARINPEHTNVEEPPASASSDARESVRVPASDVGRPTRAKRKFEEMSPAAQAGMLCDDESFRRFLSETVRTTAGVPSTPEQAADVVRRYCGVNSRKDIPHSDKLWSGLVADYRHWMRAPEFA